MHDDDDIPVLRDAVARRSRATFSEEDVDEICDRLNAEAWVMIDRLLAEALSEAKDELRDKISDRLSEQFPSLIEKILREKLANDIDKN